MGEHANAGEDAGEVTPAAVDKLKKLGISSFKEWGCGK